jgi:hypothetical protein
MVFELDCLVFSHPTKVKASVAIIKKVFFMSFSVFTKRIYETTNPFVVLFLAQTQL